MRTFRHACPKVMLLLLLENSLYGTFHRGAENSFAMRPWMAYEKGSSQYAHTHQLGMSAANTQPSENQAKT